MGWFSNAYNRITGVTLQDIGSGISGAAKSVGSTLLMSGTGALDLLSTPFRGLVNGAHAMFKEEGTPSPFSTKVFPLTSLVNEKIGGTADWVNKPDMAEFGAVAVDLGQSALAASPYAVPLLALPVAGVAFVVGAVPVAVGAAAVAGGTILAGATVAAADSLGLENTIGKRVKEIGTFHLREPARALALDGQGALNAATSMVGFTGDALRMVGTATVDVLSMPARGFYNGIYALGKEDDAPFPFPTKAFPLTSTANEYSGGAFGWTEGLNESTQIAAPTENLIFVDGRLTIESAFGETISNPAFGQKIATPADGNEAPDWAVLIPNPDAETERDIVNGGQAALEIPAAAVTFVRAGALAGSAWYKATGGTMRTAESIKGAQQVDDAVNALKHSASKARGIASGTHTASPTDDLIRRIHAARTGGKVERPLKQNDVLQYLAKDAEKLREAEDRLKALKKQYAQASPESRPAIRQQINEQTELANNIMADFEAKRATVNQLAYNNQSGLEPVTYLDARAATHTQTSATAQEGSRAIGTRTHNVVDPGRSLRIETVAAGGAYVITTHGARKEAEEEIAGAQKNGTYAFDKNMEQHGISAPPSDEKEPDLRVAFNEKPPTDTTVQFTNRSTDGGNIPAQPSETGQTKNTSGDTFSPSVLARLQFS